MLHRLVSLTTFALQIHYFWHFKFKKWVFKTNFLYLKLGKNRAMSLTTLIV